jgi:hypothetical protein
MRLMMPRGGLPSLQERFCLVCASEVVFLLRAQAALIIEAIMSIYVEKELLSTQSTKSQWINSRM